MCIISCHVNHMSTYVKSCRLCHECHLIVQRCHRLSVTSQTTEDIQERGYDGHCIHCPQRTCGYIGLKIIPKTEDPQHQYQPIITGHLSSLLSNTSAIRRKHSLPWWRSTELKHHWAQDCIGNESSHAKWLWIVWRSVKYSRSQC